MCVWTQMKHHIWEEDQHYKSIYAITKLENPHISINS